MAREKTNDKWTDYVVPWVEEDGRAPFRYRVESSDPLSYHLVDMTQRDGLGECSCKHWHTVANPNWKRLGFEIPYAPKRAGVTSCKHIAAVEAHMMKHVWRKVLAASKAGVAAPPQTRYLPGEED